MIRLNLFSEESKQKIQQQRFFFLFLKTELVLFLLLIICGTIFLAAERILSGSVQKIESETSKIIKTSSNDYSLEVKKINGTLLAVEEIQKGFTPYSPLLKKVATLAPDGVSFSYLRIDNLTKTIKLRGQADLRENFLNLVKNLEDAPFLNNIEVPLTDKLKKENIDFDIDLGFDLTKI